MVDGIEIKKSNVKGWQLNIAHVPQKVYLSDASILENIAFGIDLKNIDMDRCINVIKLAQLEDLVSGMDNGVLTPVGEDGVRISGGQRQRIGIARALYKNADVLIMDESTSALDQETEKKIMKDLNSLGEKTIIMIAHRLSTLSECDRIIELKNGKIVFDGSFHEMMTLKNG